MTRLYRCNDSDERLPAIYDRVRKGSNRDYGYLLWRAEHRSREVKEKNDRRYWYCA